MIEIVEDINSARNWFKSDIVPTAMIGLLYSGVYRGSTESGQALLDVAPVCPTNDCVFPEFESLAVCSACVDYTQNIARSCLIETTGKPLGPHENVTQCTFSLPNGLRINQTTLTLDTLAASALLKPIEGGDDEDDSIGNILRTTILNASSTASTISANAHQCSLSWCVKTYHAEVVNGSLVEREVQSRADWNRLHTGIRHFDVWGMDLSPESGRDETGFAVNERASIKITNWLLYKFTFSNSKYVEVQSDAGSDWFEFWEDDISNFTGDFRTVSHLRDTIRTMQLLGYEEVFSNVAKALTTYIRTDGSTDYRDQDSDRDSPDISSFIDKLGPIAPVNGVAYRSEVYIRIRWPWLTFLGSVLVCTIMFLALTIHKSAKYKIAAWKSEPLALMYHGLDASKEGHQRLDRVGDMHQQGKRTRVQLQETETGLRLGYADR